MSSKALARRKIKKATKPVQAPKKTRAQKDKAAQEQLQKRYARILRYMKPRLVADFVIKPSEIGTKFIFAKELSNRRGNRLIMKGRIQNLLKAWSVVVHRGTFALLDLGDGRYLIGDGQHRTVIIEMLGKNTTVKAFIYTMDDLTAAGIKYPEWVMVVSCDNHWRPVDHLAVTPSPWEQPIIDSGLDCIAEMREAKVCLTVPHILRAYVNAQDAWETTRLTGFTKYPLITAPGLSDLTYYWKNSSYEEAYNACRVMRWWFNAVKNGAAPGEPVPKVFWTHRALTFAFLLAWHSRTNPRIQDSRLKERMYFEGAYLNVAHALGSKHTVAQQYCEALGHLNDRCRIRFEIFGITGSPEERRQV